MYLRRRTKTASDKKAKDAITEAYQVRGTVSLCEEKIEPIRSAAGRFILATNVLDEDVLTAEEMLSNYKNQQAVETGLGLPSLQHITSEQLFGIYFKTDKQKIERKGVILINFGR